MNIHVVRHQATFLFTGSTIAVRLTDRHFRSSRMRCRFTTARSKGVPIISWREASSVEQPPAMSEGRPPKEVRYTAFLLDEDSRVSLLAWTSEVGHVVPPEWTTSADHLTLCHRPSPERMLEYTGMCGFRCELKVLGVAKDHRTLAVHVDVPDYIPNPDAPVRT